MALAKAKAKAKARSLDIPDFQILLEEEAEADELEWTHIVLLHKLGNGKWIGLDADHELTPVDLLARRYKVQNRASDFPDTIYDEIYRHEPISNTDLLSFRRQARTQAAILDDSIVVADGSNEQVWAVATGPLKFRIISAEEMEADGMDLCGQYRGVITLQGEETFVERTTRSELQAAVAAPASGSNGSSDHRVLNAVLDASGRRHLPLRDALPQFSETAISGWSQAGPRVVLEWLRSVVDGPGNLTMYDQTWRRDSKVGEISAPSISHHVLCEVVRLAVEVDQLDVTSLESFELLVRRVVQDETAVARNPRHPDYSGLSLMVSAPVTTGGQAITEVFTGWVTERLRHQATIMKQSRLWSEEARAANSQPNRPEWSNRDGDKTERRKAAKPKDKAKAKNKSKARPRRDQDDDEEEDAG